MPKKRLEWALKYQHYTREDWSKIAWSDESMIQKDSARQQIWVFRYQTKKKSMHQRIFEVKEEMEMSIKWFGDVLWEISWGQL